MPKRIPLDKEKLDELIGLSNLEEAQDLEYQKELSEWDILIGDGLS